MQRFSNILQRVKSALPLVCLILLSCGLWPEMEILVPSLPNMKSAFKVSDGQIQQLLTVNFLGFVLGVLVAGPLCDTLGRRVVLVRWSLVYLVVSFLSALVDNFYLITALRFLQGIAMTGPIVAVGVILLELTSGTRQVFWLSLSSFSVTFCMAIAPILGSWVNAWIGYKGNLWAIFFLGCSGIIPSFFFIEESLQAGKKKLFHPAMLSRGYILLLQNWRFMSLALPMSALSAAYWIYIGISALYMVDYLGLPAIYFGRYQGPIIGCFAIVSLSTSWILKRFGLLCCIKAGTLAMIIGCASLLTISLLSHESAIAITIFMMIFVGGMAPVNNILFPCAIACLPAELKGSAQALLNALRLSFASLGTFILSLVYSGPFLPVAIILSSMLAISILFLYLSRSFLRERTQDLPTLHH